MDLPEVLFSAVFVPVACFSWVGILLAEFGAFAGWRVAAGGTLLSVLAFAAAAREHLKCRVPLAPVSLRSWLSLVLVVALSAGLFSRPGEYLIEGADASVYVAIGRNIERTGGIISTDPMVDFVPPSLRGSFFPTDDRRPTVTNRLPGGLRTGPDGRVWPSFFHLLPVWLAIATAAGGPYAAYFVNAALALLGGVLVWLIGRRVWSPVAGLVAALLLVFNFGQIYHSQLPSSEMLAQFLLLSSVFFTVIAWDQGTRVSGACAGAAIGLAAFARVDTMLIMVPLAVTWLVLARRHQPGAKAWRWYAATLVVVAGHAVIHAVTVAGVYTRGLIKDGLAVMGALPQQIEPVTMLAIIVTLGAIGLVLIRFRGRWLTGACIAATLTLAILSPAVVVTTSRLLSPVGLIAAVAGLAWIFTRGLTLRVAPIVIPFAAAAALLLAWREAISLPHDFRRAVPVILPAAMLLIGFLVAEIAGRRGWLSRTIWLLPVGLATAFLYDSAPILRTPPGQGIHAQIESIARHIPANALVLTDRSVSGHLALSLQYSFGRSALRLASRPESSDGLAPLIERSLETGRPVFAVIAPFFDDRPEGLWRRDFVNFGVREESVVPIRYRAVQAVTGAFPRALREDDSAVAVYRITALDTQTRSSVPLTVDIGGDDFRFLIQGFHGAESIESVTARWTTGESHLLLPRLAGPTLAVPTLVLRLSAHRPAGLAPAVIHLAIDGIPVGVITGAASDFREFRMPLPPPALARLLERPAVLTLKTDTFVPSMLGLNTDSRPLGMMLDWIRIE